MQRERQIAWAARREPVNRRTVAARKRCKARSTAPWLQRRSLAGSPAWREPTCSPDLIALYAGLAKTAGEPEASPR